MIHPSREVEIYHHNEDMEQPENTCTFEIKEERKQGDPGDSQAVVPHQNLINRVKTNKKKQKKPRAKEQGRHGLELPNCIGNERAFGQFLQYFG